MCQQPCRRWSYPPTSGVRNGSPGGEMLTNFIDDSSHPVDLSGRVGAGAQVKRSLIAAPLALLSRFRYGSHIAALAAPLRRRRVQRTTVVRQGLMAGRHEIRG